MPSAEGQSEGAEGETDVKCGARGKFGERFVPGEWQAVVASVRGDTWCSSSCHDGDVVSADVDGCGCVSWGQWTGESRRQRAMASGGSLLACRRMRRAGIVGADEDGLMEGVRQSRFVKRFEQGQATGVAVAWPPSPKCRLAMSRLEWMGLRFRLSLRRAAARDHHLQNLRWIGWALQAGDAKIGGFLSVRWMCEEISRGSASVDSRGGAGRKLAEIISLAFKFHSVDVVPGQR